MFGMGFTEILIIAVIAILFLGPDKLPGTLVDIAKFFKNVKSTVGSVKDSLEQEMNVSDIKQEALAYKAKLEKAASGLDDFKDIKGTVSKEITSMAQSVTNNELPTDTVKKADTTPQEVTFKKKKKNIEQEEITDV
ncbi:Sec-independent protein translocase protein TatB [Sulfurimonas sp.]|jgi:sec-independent protein translocase protein TatB|uniref:Sec-independent protein translocase protein TatB n=1 Tax=Sulfurimonas sp. TaxID=2022749 RepID=UPI0025F6B17A|nr:Sec-independent protein translocase protein TatB [Sulfurimonas sp.]MBT5933902.1 Sec-independent protein translocase subunit TatB [Sulfurimonas sp.]